MHGLTVTTQTDVYESHVNSPACAADADKDDDEADGKSDDSNGHDRYN